MEPSVYSIGKPSETLSANGFTRSGYRFVGWSYTPQAEQAGIPADATLEEVMKHGEDFPRFEDVTLYAVWEAEEPENDTPVEENDTEETEETEAAEETEAVEETEAATEAGTSEGAETADAAQTPPSEVPESSQEQDESIPGKE